MVFWQGLLYWSDDLATPPTIYKTSVVDGATRTTGISLTYTVKTVEFYGHAENCTYTMY